MGYLEESPRRAVFFDRDGIVNVSPGAGYVTRPEDLQIMPGFPDVLQLVKERGYLAVVVSNQRCVAAGIIDLAMLSQIHDRLQRDLQVGWSVGFDDILFCPHDRDENCDCRKPRPGMLLMAAEKYAIDLGASWMAGDQPRDIEAGRAAGCRTVFVGNAAGFNEAGADFHAAGMPELLTIFDKQLI